MQIRFQSKSALFSLRHVIFLLSKMGCGKLPLKQIWLFLAWSSGSTYPAKGSIVWAIPQQ